jgi:hypothetical protein
MHWRLKRQLVAIGILGLLVAAIAFGLFFWFRVSSPPSAAPSFNGTPQPLRLLWTRFFLIRQGVYDVAALLENPNDRARAVAIPYVFRLFDENDILVAVKEGKGFINSGERFVIVEPLIATGVRVPKRVSFEIQNVAWEAKEKIVLPVIVKQKRFETSGADTLVRATFMNPAVAGRATAALEAVFVLADEQGNAAAAARAIVDPLATGEEREAVLTWPRALPEPHTIQIYVRERP